MPAAPTFTTPAAWPSFSSSFHVDVASGVGAFASSTITAFADYRPRLLTRFAVDALTNVLAGRPLPAPPRLDVALSNSAAYRRALCGAGRRVRGPRRESR